MIGDSLRDPEDDKRAREEFDRSFGIRTLNAQIFNQNRRISDLESQLSSALSAKEEAEAQAAALATVAGKLAHDASVVVSTYFGGEDPDDPKGPVDVLDEQIDATRAALTPSVQSLAEQARLKDAVVKAAEQWRDDEEDVPEIAGELIGAVDTLRDALRQAKGESQPPEEQRNG